MAAPTLVETLAGHVARTRLSDLPAEVIARAKLCLLDTLGVAVAGTRDRVARTVAAHAVAHGAPGRSTVLGRDERLRPEYAALANGTAAHALDWDDGHRPSGDHLGGPVVPAAVAV